MTYTFLVKATVYYEIDEHETTEYGIVHAENYASAASIVEKYFRDDLCDMTLTMTEDEDFTCIDRTIYNRIHYGIFDTDEDLPNQTQTESTENATDSQQASATDDTNLISDFM